jgi:hypothetical protein
MPSIVAIGRKCLPKTPVASARPIESRLWHHLHNKRLLAYTNLYRDELSNHSPLPLEGKGRAPDRAQHGRIGVRGEGNWCQAILGSLHCLKIPALRLRHRIFHQIEELLECHVVFGADAFEHRLIPLLPPHGT